MLRTNFLLTLITIALTAFAVGRWSGSTRTVRADSGSPLIQVQAIRGDTSLTVYYPSLNQLFVYQTPFIGLPKWGCAYSVQLSTPGGNIERQPCPNRGQAR